MPAITHAGIAECSPRPDSNTPTAMISSRLTLALLTTSLTLALPSAHADIMVGDATAASAGAGTNLPELLLVIWDPVAKVSYSKDLGVLAYSSQYAAGDTSKNLFVHGQQDAGYQKLFSPLNADPLFQQFIAQSGGASQQIWGILGVQTDAELESQGGFRTAFMTLNTGTQASGVRNPNYSTLVGIDENGNALNPGAIFNNSELGDSVGNFTAYAANLNAGGGNANNTHQCAAAPTRCTGANAPLKDGSSFDTIASPGYAAVMFQAGGAMVSNGHASIMNPVGKSSWFYSVTTSSDVSDVAPAVDEFDNGTLAGGHDAYWGLGVAPNGDYILSYTLEASMTQPQTAAGSLLRLRTDFAASYGRARLIAVPGGDTLNLGSNISPVPEPATWGLMGLGLAALALRARRRC